MGGDLMELELHSINGMRNMEVIDVLTGSKLGFIRDLKIDCDTNKVISLILPGEVKSWFGKDEEKEIPWKNIVKIGADVILVKSQGEIDNDINNIQQYKKNDVIIYISKVDALKLRGDVNEVSFLFF